MHIAPRPEGDCCTDLAVYGHPPSLVECWSLAVHSRQNAAAQNLSSDASFQFSALRCRPCLAESSHIPFKGCIFSSLQPAVTHLPLTSVDDSETSFIVSTLSRTACIRSVSDEEREDARSLDRDIKHQVLFELNELAGHSSRSEFDRLV